MAGSCAAPPASQFHLRLLCRRRQSYKLRRPDEQRQQHAHLSECAFQQEQAAERERQELHQASIESFRAFIKEQIATSSEGSVVGIEIPVCVLVETHPAFIECMEEIQTFRDNAMLRRCPTCSETTWGRPRPSRSTRSTRSTGSPNECNDCVHDKKRAKQFSSSNKTMPTIFTTQSAFAKAFLEGVPSGGESEDQATDPRFEFFEIFTPAEHAICSFVRLFLIVNTNFGGAASTKGMAIAFRGINPALEVVAKLPNTISPFVLVVQQKADGTYPHPDPSRKALH